MGLAQDFPHMSISLGLGQFGDPFFSLNIAKQHSQGPLGQGLIGYKNESMDKW